MLVVEGILQLALPPRSLRLRPQRLAHGISDGGGAEGGQLPRHGKELRVLDVHAAATGFQGEICWDASKPVGTPKKQLDVSRLATLGWQARIPLKEGLRSTVDLFRKGSEARII